MKLLSLFFLFLCLIEIYGERVRTANANQDVTTQEPKTPRGRGRTRFSVTDELPSSSERPSSNRRASTRTRIHSNNPKAAADRRVRPITEAPRGYAVEEVNNDSPIDSFIRQSKPRVLTESRFEIPVATVSRRPQTYQLARTSPVPPTVDDIEVGGFGSTARAILQARGESLPVKTTTPLIDEAYLLNNFGSTIRSLVAAINEVPIQRATPLRSEVPILDQEDIPLRRSSLRGDPLPSLRGSDISRERQTSIRGRTRGQTILSTDQTRDSLRTNSQRKATEQTRPYARIDSKRKTIEDTPVGDLARLESETEAPESVQGIFDESDLVTETQPLEAPDESLILEDEELRKTSSAEVVTQKVTEPAAVPRQNVVNIRRPGVRERTVTVLESQSTSAPRAFRTRAPQVEIYTAPSARIRGVRRKYDDTVVAESRSRGPSVFTAEQYQEVTSRSRPERRIDSRLESVPASVPERITVDLTPVATGRTRGLGRRATTPGTTTTERSFARERSSSRGRSRSRDIPEESTSASISRTVNSRRPSSFDDSNFYGDKTSNRADVIHTTGRKETSGRLDTIEPRAAISRGSFVETPTNRRGTNNRAEAISSRSRGSTAESRRQVPSRTESVEPRNIVSSRNSGFRQNGDAVSYGVKSSRTKTQSSSTTTTTTEEPTTIINRSKSRFSEVPPKIDESKLEVLPLFERETKTVPSVRFRGHRSRSSINKNQNLSHDHMQGSATENDVKFVEKPTTNAFTRVTVTRTESVEANTSRARLSTRTASTTASSLMTDLTRNPTSSSTTTKAPETSTATKKWVTRSPPLIRESVVAEVNEVTSKTTFTRRKKVSKAKANEVLSRGSKKADVKLIDTGKKPSEEIDDEDNYPESFKALIQAKKKQVEARPSQSSPRVAVATSSSSSTSTEKVFVTSAASPRGSSSNARVVTTESPSKRSQLNEIVNDNENELDPKPTIISTTPTTSTRAARPRQLPKFSEKPKYTQKPREKLTKSVTEKPRYSLDRGTTKTTSAPKKPNSTKSYFTRDPVEHHSKRKALRSTAFPPSTTPMNLVNREAKFSAKFIRKEKSFDSSNSKNQQVKGLYSSKKGGEEEERSGRNISLTQTPKPSLPIKKFNASRYSSRYRSDPSQRSTVLRSSTSAPFYIPTIPTPAYVPTIPTIAPSVTPVGGFVAEKDKDLGLEVISFDDPVNTIPSADLVNGEYLTTDKNIRLSPMVKDGTTEKPVSIIERIINSITAISTTEAPNITTTTTSTISIEATENSAILKLAPKKITTKDKTIPDYQTNIIETITSEKPTTIIEKIRSSLSAIQSNEVGTPDFNTVSSTSTTPLSTVTKYSAKFRGSVGITALPAPLPLSTSINPLSVFDEIDKNQVLEKRTIGKLLNILNGLVSTNSPESSEKLVVVTPKNILNSGASPIGFVATTFSSQEPLEALSLNDIVPRADFDDSESSVSSSTVNTESTTSGSTVNTESSTSSSIVNTEPSTMNTESSTQSVQKDIDTTPTTSFNTETSLPENNTVSMPLSTQITTQSSTTSTLPTTTSSLTTNVKSLEIDSNSLSLDLPNTSTSTSEESTTVTSDFTTSSDTITTTFLPQATSNVEGLSSSILYTFPSTLPTIPNIEVESNRMARLLENEQTVPTSFPSRIGISSTTSSIPLSQIVVSSTTPSTTTIEPKITSTANSLPSTTSTGSTLISSTISENSDPSTTTLGTTMMFTSTLPSSTTSQDTSTTTMSSNIVKIMAIPGETRISKPQTPTSEPSSVSQSTVESSTTQASTIAQSTTETIPPTLGEILNGEILNGKTVNALANLLTNAAVSTTQASNFKTLEVSQNSITSTTTVQTTTMELSTEKAPFTSPILNTERTTQLSTSEDRLLSSTLISTLMPASTTTQEPKTQRVTITSTTSPLMTTTNTMRTTTPEIKTMTQKVESTTQKLTTTVEPKIKTTGATKTTTGFPVFMPSTIFPTILTTLFPNLLRSAVTTPSSPLSTTRQPFTSPDLSNRIGDRFEILSAAGTTARPTTVLPQTSTSQRISTTTTPPPTTTTRQTTTQTTTEFTTTTTTQKPTTTMKPKPTTTRARKSETVTPSIKVETDALYDQLKQSGKLKNLNEEQRKNLEEIERIEKEQAELLKQLTLLTTMFGGQTGNIPKLPPLQNNNPIGGNSLANRVIAMAMERDRAVRSSTANPPTTTTKKSTKETTKRPNSIQDQLPVSQEGGVTQRTTPSLEDVLKQYNLSGLSTPVPLTSTYGKTDEALLAAILKEQGIGPTTPKILGDKVKEAGLFEEILTTKPPRPKTKPRPTTTARPVGGRLMQGLNWLLDILDPPTTKRPAARKTKAKTEPSKENSGDEELLTNQPTRITPIVTAAPVTKPNLSQEEIQILIKQLEAVQDDPNAADQLDFSKIKNLQNLINVNEGVQVTSAGQHGATSRATPRPPKVKSTTEKDPFLTEINKKPRSSTVSTLSVSNSIDDDDDVELISTTTRTRVLPPVSLNPIPGIDNPGDSLIRSNLLTAAVNVTRAISSFLGSALQGATRGFRSLIGSGSAVAGNIAQTSNLATG